MLVNLALGDGCGVSMFSTPTLNLMHSARVTSLQHTSGTCMRVAHRSTLQAETLGGQGIGSSSCVAASIASDEDRAAEPCTTASSPGGLPASASGDLGEGGRPSLSEDADGASGAAADADETSSQVSEQDHAPDALDDGEAPLSITERSMQALADAGELVAGLIAATVTASPPRSGADEGENISMEVPARRVCPSDLL